MGQAINIMSDKAKPRAVAKAKKPEASHPASSVMVKAAIENLKERKGSSLIAIRKYIGTNYKVDPVKISAFLKKALKSGVEKKTIIQVKGVGASGSFKLAKEEPKPKKSAKPKTAAKKPTSSKAKKVAPKKKPTAAKKATPKKKKVEKSKSAKPSAKAKKPVAKKAPAKKPASKAAPKKK